MRPIILISIAHYLPGWKFGGPTSTIANLVEHLGDEFEFRIFTSDRDFGDKIPYSGVTRDRWVQVGKSKVFYVSTKRLKAMGMVKLIKDTPHDLLYLNSFFQPDFTIVPLLARWLRLVPDAPCVVAPRGELAPAALALKGAKKLVFLKLARLFGLYRGVRWQASSRFEAEDIRRIIGSDLTDVTIAANLPRAMKNRQIESVSTDSYAGALRVVFIARISKMKNIDFALKVLLESKVPIIFDVWGTIEDDAYWSTCVSIIESMPSHVRVNYFGGAPREKVEEILSRYDLMFMPSLGENFGHVIAESLSVGTPVLISDKTPWRNLAPAGAGWDFPITEGTGVFVEALTEASGRARAGAEGWRAEVLAYAQRGFLDSTSPEENRRLFLDAIQSSSSRKNLDDRAA